MTTWINLTFHCRNLGAKSLRDRFSAKCEPAAAGHITAMREAEKVERFRLSVPTGHAVSGRAAAAKCNQASHLLVVLQTKTGKTLSECFQTTLCFVLTFKADHEVIRISQRTILPRAPCLRHH